MKGLLYFLLALLGVVLAGGQPRQESFLASFTKKDPQVPDKFQYILPVPSGLKGYNPTPLTKQPLQQHFSGHSPAHLGGETHVSSSDSPLAPEDHDSASSTDQPSQQRVTSHPPAPLGERTHVPSLRSSLLQQIILPSFKSMNDFSQSMATTGGNGKSSTKRSASKISKSRHAKRKKREESLPKLEFPRCTTVKEIIERWEEFEATQKELKKLKGTSFKGNETYRYFKVANAFHNLCIAMEEKRFICEFGDIKITPHIRLSIPLAKFADQKLCDWNEKQWNEGAKGSGAIEWEHFLDEYRLKDPQSKASS